MNKKSKIILALDTNNLKKIKRIIFLISKDIYAVKVGYQFYFNFGSEGIKIIQRYKLKIFFDFKLHGIPNTTLMGIKQIMKYKPDMLTLHISGGKNMLSLAKSKSKKIKLIGVSVLTSLDNKCTARNVSPAPVILELIARDGICVARPLTDLQLILFVPLVTIASLAPKAKRESAALVEQAIFLPSIAEASSKFE